MSPQAFTTCVGGTTRRAWWNVARRRGAMVVPRLGRRERSYRCYTGATEDDASGRPARPGGSAPFRQSLLGRRFSLAEPGRDDALAGGVARLVPGHGRQEVVAAQHEQRAGA